MNGPIFGGSDAEDNMDSGRLDDRTESLLIVDTILLSEATNHPTCFITCKRVIVVVLMTKDPLPHYHIDTYRSRNKNPSILIH
jgi:hypothetical protein